MSASISVAWPGVLVVTSLLVKIGLAAGAAELATTVAEAEALVAPLFSSSGIFKRRRTLFSSKLAGFLSSWLASRSAMLTGASSTPFAGTSTFAHQAIAFSTSLRKFGSPQFQW